MLSARAGSPLQDVVFNAEISQWDILGGPAIKGTYQNRLQIMLLDRGSGHRSLTEPLSEPQRTAP